MNLEHVQQYALRHTTKDSALIRELVDRTQQELDYPEMLSGPLVGRLLGILINVSQARRILDVGTFTGYSALTMAESLPDDGELYTFEYNKRYETIARSYFERSEHGYKINLVTGDARKTITETEGLFDMAFLDADKIHYPEYYEMIVPRLVSGGLLVVDNVLWSGDVIEAESEKAEAIDRLNQRITADDRVEQVMLTVRDGLMLVRKRTN